MSKKNYSVELRNMFIIKNISDRQASLLTTLNVSNQIDIKVNLLDISYTKKDNGLYDLYISVGNTNDEILTNIMEEQYKKNILALNLPYQIKKSIVVGAFNQVITNVPGIWRRFITQAYEVDIPLELFINSVGTKNDPIEQTIVLLCENPFDVDRLVNIIFNTNYADFDKMYQINNSDVLCIVKNEYRN